MAGTATEFETDLVVADKHHCAQGVVTLSLRQAHGEPLPAWTPGAHIDLLLGQTPVRQYSLCGDPDDPTLWRVSVLLEPDGAGTSRVIHDDVQPGDKVRVRGPRNHFELEASPRYLFIAGGIGITPLLPMIRTADAAGADWRLEYGGRRRCSMAFLDELAVYGDRVSVWPRDECDRVDLAAVLTAPQPHTLVYCCGPESLVAAVEGHCAAWPQGALHVERFTPKPVGEPVRTEAFDVVLAESGLTLSIPPERSIVAVLSDAGISVLTSCEEGTCGTCETAVLEGIPDHRDSVLNERERAANDCLMVCVSRSCTSRLVLEL